jgi:hypothetical protein
LEAEHLGLGFAIVVPEADEETFEQIGEIRVLNSPSS